ncbi:ketoacyl-ACP synthase III [Kiloniella laminariae]|uniref:Beta-ketoacyl-[acyl-carrier-protein] synthase III n=1 Tax=Kiloniella laminariae TaxID=454162 RepID=A0ABT4LG98_9PROT|nr:beta-ketoacyl-ACP synthase III [Kiloniella laminariae]MCZ4280127.1 ketoacyl-ACP synthase III [Kiloniella laminariae]
MMIRSVIKGCGSYLPERIVTNDQLAERVDTSDEWIQQRTGIKHRYVAGENELTSDLATKAAKAALEHAGIDAVAVDLIVCATATPDETFPATATVVQKNLGIFRGAAFDLQAVCSGFVYGLSVVDSMIRAGQAKTVLLIGAETFSRILDWEDRSTCVLFGDGAGAVVLQAEEGCGENQDRGILNTHIYSDGRYHDALYVDGGPSSTGVAGFLRMEGKEVFRQAVSRMPESIDAALEKSGLVAEDIDWLVPHQANIRIIEAMGKKLRLPKERVVITVDKHANTSAASIPLALTEAVYDGRIKQGDMIMMTAMGGGFTWGSALLRW